MTATRTVHPLWPGELLQVGPRRLHVRRAAAGAAGAEPALFVHGLGGSATNWTDLMGELAGALAGTAVDLPGCGWSPPPADRDYSLAAHVAAVVELIEADFPAPVHLLGNSLGGAVTTRVAALRPDLVRTLVLVSPALPIYRVRRTNAHLPALAAPVVGEQLVRRLAGVAVERRVHATLGLIYADPRRVAQQRIEEAVAEARRRAELPYDAEALMSSLRGILTAYLQRGPEGLWQSAGRVRAPVLLVYGLRDQLVDPRTATRAMRTFRDARLVELPGSGHVAQMEQPAVVAHAIRLFLADVAASPRTPALLPDRPAPAQRRGRGGAT